IPNRRRRTTGLPLWTLSGSHPPPRRRGMKWCGNRLRQTSAFLWPCRETLLPSPIRSRWHQSLEGGTQEFFCHQESGSSVQSGPWVCRCSDVIEPGDGRAVIWEPCKRAQDEELVRRARAPVGVASNQIDIVGLEIGRREHYPLQNGVLQVRDLMA